LNDFLPFAVWRSHRLTRTGRRILRRTVAEYPDVSHCIAVIHDNICAMRVNQIVDVLNVPYVVILYDLMHLAAPTPENFPDLAKCVSKAFSVFGISDPLLEAARTLGAKKVERISFYRPRSGVEKSKVTFDSNDSYFRILVLADAKPTAFEELLSAVCSLRDEFPLKVVIHFVGNSGSLSNLVNGYEVEVVFHGFVSSEERDRIAAECDIAFLAGSTLNSNQCPLVKYSIPSKLGDFAALELPVVARFSKESAAASQITRDYSGFVCLTTSQEEITDILRSFLKDQMVFESKRKGARAFASQSLYLPNATTDKLGNLFCYL
jgi:hypothetical protein